MKKAIKVVVVTAVFLSCSAWGQTSLPVTDRLDKLVGFEHLATQIAEEFFESIDADGDGKLTMKEYLAPVLKQFQDADKNGDGTLTKAELTEAMFVVMQKAAVDSMLVDPRTAKRQPAAGGQPIPGPAATKHGTSE